MPKGRRRLEKVLTRTVKGARSPDEAKEILDVLSESLKPKIEAQKVRTPGVTIEGRKIAYTRSDLDRMFPPVEFTPEETILITYQGVSFQLFSGVTMMVPSVIQKEYTRHRREVGAAGKRIDGLGFDTTVELGAGALPPPDY